MMNSLRPVDGRSDTVTIEDESYHKAVIDAQHAGFNPPRGEFRSLRMAPRRLSAGQSVLAFVARQAQFQLVDRGLT